MFNILEITEVMEKAKVNLSGYFPLIKGCLLMVSSCYLCTSLRNPSLPDFHMQYIIKSNNVPLSNFSQVCPLLSFLTVTTLIQVTIMSFPVYENNPGPLVFVNQYLYNNHRLFSKYKCFIIFLY